MDIKEVLENLCIYDSRSPYYFKEDNPEEISSPRDGCACENCFYGRDRFALEVIRLFDVLAKAESYIGILEASQDYYYRAEQSNEAKAWNSTKGENK